MNIVLPRALVLVAALALSLAACSGDDAPAPVTPTSSHAGGASDPHDRAPGKRVDLGQATVAGFALRVFQLGAPTPGEEGDFDVEAAATGGKLSGTLRGWIGEESGKGSRKTRFHAETATRMHGHPEVPDPLPPDARLWLEVEAGGTVERASFALQR